MALFSFLKRRRRGDDPARAERLLWQMIRARQPADCKVRRHAQFDGYFVDFLCPRKRLVILLTDDCSLAPDDVRNAHLESHGFRILGISRDLACSDPEAAWARIAAALDEPLPPPH